MIDGDTLDIDGRRYRLWGIDAPELSERHGRQSKDLLIQVVRDKRVECIDMGTRTHGRTVALCRVNGADIAQILVRAGAAIDCPRYSWGKYRQYEPTNVRMLIKQKPYCEARR